MVETAAQRLASLTGTLFHDAICYSGYREGQSPLTGSYPTYDQIREDLALVRKRWRVIRIYDCGVHGQITLEVVRREFPDMRVLVGAALRPEVNNPHCAWAKIRSEEQLELNRQSNDAQVMHVAATAAAYQDVVLAVSTGNEVTVDWTENLVPTERVAGFLALLKQHQPRPVTLCDNHVPWQAKIATLVPLVDFISIHSYPVWENVPLHEALARTEADYRGIADRYPDKPVIITEAGWCTTSNGRGIQRDCASPESQAAYVPALVAWSRRAGIPVCLFEAFDEPWKGSDDPDEPEKHWGLYGLDRAPKPVVARLSSEAFT